MKKELDKKVEEIDNLLEEIGKTHSKTVVYDGIANTKRYLKSKYKILWILKEANDPDGEESWDLRNLMNDAIEDGGLATNMVSTFKDIIYTSYGLLNGFKQWDDIEYIDDNNSVADVLKDIAFINISKFPGGSTSNEKDLEENYQIFKNIVLKQIKEFSPQIIICGNTCKFIEEDLDLSDMEFVKEDAIWYYLSSKRIVIDAWHPAQRQLTDQKYCDSIIDAVRNWTEKYEK